MKILILEDDRLSHSYLAQLAKNDDPSTTVDSAFTLGEAQKLVDSNSYDMVISDLSLPDAVPLETIRFLYPLIQDIPKIKVIVSTQIADEKLVAEICAYIGTWGLYHKTYDAKLLEHLITQSSPSMIHCSEIKHTEKIEALLNLSERHRNIIKAMCQGENVKSIAHDQAVGYNAISAQLSKIRQQIGHEKTLIHLFV